MKYFKLLCIVIAILITIPVYCKEHISLYGKWVKSQRSLVNDLPIHAWIEDTNEELSLSFDKDLGNISVTISDSFGTILYNKIINTNEYSSFIIPIKNIEGECVLSITDGKNNIFGQFFIN